MRAYEIHTYRDGIWKIDSVFDDRQLAMFDAKRITEGTRYAGVKVIEETYDEESGLTTTRTLFRGGAAKSKSKGANAQSGPNTRPAMRTGTGKEPVKLGRARPEKNKTNMAVPVLVALLLLFAGLTIILGIEYLSELK